MVKKPEKEISSDFAIIRSGNKQYLVSKGDKILVDRLPAKTKKDVNFETLLACKNAKLSLGSPTVKTSTKGKILSEVKDKKVMIFKYAPKKRYRKKSGFRALKSEVEITSI
jgi:large subunit ribosomal protein L21